MSQQNAWFVLPEDHVFMEANRPAEKWALGLLGAFTRLQEVIEGTVAGCIEASNPHLSQVIYKKHLQRLTDDERWAYVKALAVDVSYVADMQPASDAFWGCKRVRDIVGHSYSLDLVYDTDLGSYRYQYNTAQHKNAPDPLTPAVLRRMVTDAHWLAALVRHIGYLGGVKCIGAGHRHPDGRVHFPWAEVPDPGPRPQDSDWEPPVGGYLPCDEGGFWAD